MLAGARIGSYIEIVTDIPMPGQLVELNKQAWLLLFSNVIKFMQIQTPSLNHMN